MIFFAESKNYFPEIKSLKKQVSSYNETINTAQKVRSSIDKTLGEYNVISQENVDKINKMIPSGAESMKLVVQVDDMVRKNGLSLASIGFKDVINKESVSDIAQNGDKIAEPVSFSISARGSYESFYYFIKKLEKSLRLIDIGSVKISPADQGNHSFSIEAVSYWRKMGKKI